MSFMIEDDSVLVKCDKIWSKIKKTLNIKFHSMPVYDEIYIEVKEFNGVTNRNVQGDKVPKKVCITLV